MRCHKCGNVLQDVYCGKCAECGEDITTIETMLYAYMPEKNEIEEIEELLSVNGRFAIVAFTLLKYKGKEKTVVVPEGIRRIGHRAFWCCKSVEKIQLPNSIKWIDDSAFHACLLLKEINLPEGVEQIGQHAFELCKSLEKMELPNSIKEIEKSAFNGCENLKEINIPEGVKEIAEFVFSTCKSLERIQLPDSIRVIGLRAFWRCESLKQINIPKGMKLIGEGAFDGCENLVIYFEGSRSQWEWITSDYKLPDSVRVVYGEE